MSSLAALAMAARALWAHRFRSLLTVTSITLGAFAIVLMSSLAESGLATLWKTVEDLGGGRMLLFVPKTPEREENRAASYERGLTRLDREHIERAVPHTERITEFATLGEVDAWGESGSAEVTDLVAADADFLEFMSLELARGRGFSEAENRGHAEVCVVGHELGKKLWRQEPVGRFATFGAHRCRVVGVLAPADHFGMNFGFDWDDVVVMPREAVADREPRAQAEGLIAVKTTDSRHNEIVKRVANQVLVRRHHGIDDFQIYDMSNAVEGFEKVFLLMKVIVGLLAGIALLIGGVGVMNMMLVSVSERVREIGIQRALGARGRDIRVQFLAESTLLSVFGGALGVALGVGAALAAAVGVAAAIPRWVGQVSEGATIVALVVSVGIGVVFGYVPARRAAELRPIEAIRR